MVSHLNARSSERKDGRWYTRRCKQKRKQRDMSGHRKRTEGAKISAIFECKETECDTRVSENENRMRDPLEAYLNGKITSKMAFSCTCHPNRNDAYPHNVTAPMNCSYVGRIQSFIKHNWTISAFDMPQGKHFRTVTYDLEKQSKNERRRWSHIREHSKCGISNKSSGNTINRGLIHGQS